MARSSILSNGRLCVGLDEKGFVHDFYYPYVGLHNMTSARFIHHKIGIVVDGVFSWLDSDDWSAESALDEHTMMARTRYENQRIGIAVAMRDFVDNEFDFFGRLVIVENHSNEDRNVKLFFAQVFQISSAGRSDTALYVPARDPYILTYYRDTAFVTGLRTEELTSFDQFAVGNYGIEGKGGTYLDAEDGELSGNLVEHASVDSVIRSSFLVRAKHSYHLDYWTAASDKGYSPASKLHRSLQSNGLYHYLNAHTIASKKWLATGKSFIDQLDVRYQKLARNSLFTVKAHQDARGGVLASADSSIYNYGRDYYSYVWPRDAYYALSPLLAIGYHEEIRSYLEFTARTIHPRGYVHHKYAPDGALGSSWHPMMQDGLPELNIQEDETASIVLLALDYIADTERQKSDEWIYRKIVVPAANFMASFIDEETGLPLPSYDLWEQIFLTSTYTCSIVYSALLRSSELAKERGDQELAGRWRSVAETIKKNKAKLFSEKHQWFVRGLRNKEHSHAQDTTLDISSLYGPVRYGLCDIQDTSVFATLSAVEANLQEGGGYIRYPGDGYMLTSKAKGNPWFIGTLWVAEIYHLLGKEAEKNLCLDWVVDHQTKSGMLSEQIDPHSGEIRGVAPLVWSHAQFLATLFRTK
jgi:GH15 family glucan-1,4-alpha-glucosidase